MDQPQLKINSFAELMQHLAWDWHDYYILEREPDGNFVMNKTYITPTELSYKTDVYEITNPLVFKKLEKFYELLQETPIEKTLFQK